MTTAVGGRPRGYKMSDAGKAAVGRAVSNGHYLRRERLLFCSELVDGIKAGWSLAILRKHVSEYEKWEEEARSALRSG